MILVIVAEGYEDKVGNFIAVALRASAALPEVLMRRAAGSEATPSITDWECCPRGVIG